MRDRKRKRAIFEQHFLSCDFDRDLVQKSEKMAIEKYCATRYQGVCMPHSQKPRENTKDTATHTPEHKVSDHKST